MIRAALAAAFAMAIPLAGHAAGPGSAGTSQSPAAANTSQPAQGVALLHKLDRNGDGYVSRAEAKADPRIYRRFAQIDQNHDGRLSPDELDSEVASTGGGGNASVGGGMASPATPASPAAPGRALR